MFTSAECRAMAEQKLAEAERDDQQHRRRLLTAAEGWPLLASKLRDADASLPTDKPVSTRRSKHRVKARAARPDSFRAKTPTPPPTKNWTPGSNESCSPRTSFRDVVKVATTVASELTRE
jgi:hypothetical protein